jgi:carboxypeptidase D
MIGNGWISGVDQYTSYIPFMKEAGLLQEGSKAEENANRQLKACTEALNDGGKKKVDVRACETIMMGLNRDLRSGDNQCWNVYDVRLKDSYPSCGMNWPPDLTQVTPYLRRDDVIKALNISPDKKTGWRECNDQVNRAFDAAHSKPSKTLLPGLLSQMPIILFSGDKDLICNHIGTENLIENMNWNGQKGMSSAPVRDWTFDSEPAGQWQTARNLTYLRFYNSSHMVPFDYPKRAQDMLHRFMGLDTTKTGSPSGDSYIDGEDKEVAQPPPNSNNPPPPNPSPPKPADPTPTSAAEKEKIDAAKWAAYQRSGEAALVVVAIAAVLWGFFVWRARRRRRVGYQGVRSEEPYDDRPPGGGAQRDVEAAREFDEAELDDLTPGGKGRYALDEDDEEDGGEGGGRTNGHIT